MKKILIIEDEKSVLNNIQTLLEEEGYLPLTAADGEKGIEIAKKELPDLIICDIMMPKKDGYAVLQELAEDKSTKGIPFIFLTAKVEHIDLRKGMELGADDYLFKPFKLDELLKSIESRLKRFNIVKAAFVEKNDSDKSKKFKYSDRIFISVNSKPQPLILSEIIYITAENQYTSIKLQNGKVYLIRRAMTAWIKILPQEHFLRIHRATIININFIVKIEKWYNSGFLVTMKNVDEPFVISKRFASKLRTETI